ncbi:unnamed protein product [Prorocentrum cordatum]|uniref:Uncharacterized protein n=1 Tax=Prorocentrum cordatum TaxID=2364126 RepID=A0ABN9Q0P2_9DINO|nr:unnamed protein product [Polarella glacialis]
MTPEDSRALSRVMGPSEGFYHPAFGTPLAHGFPAAPMPPPAALMRARCRARSDIIVGPSVVCDTCITDVHCHCMQPWQGHAVCFACFAGRDIAYGRRQAAWSSGLAGQLGRTVASGAQMAGHAVGATISTAATGVQRLAIGAAAGARQTWAAGTMMPLLLLFGTRVLTSRGHVRLE